jgi:predicted metal-dependent enzyme (double-stranded beta helix superfamily)/predicted methyltransferase
MTAGRTTLLGVLVLGACAVAGAVGPPDPARYIDYLESPERAAWQKPDEVVRALGLAGGETVADLGAGSGYFTVRLARAVEPKGKVLALDVDGRLLRYLDERVSREGIHGTESRVVEPDDAGLAERSVDLVFLCNVYHELSDRAAYLRKLGRALRPGGRIAIVDFEKRADITEGPPFREKVARETVLEELGQAGFRLSVEHRFLPLQYFLVFAPNDAGTAAATELESLVAAVDSTVKLRLSPERTTAEVARALRGFLDAGRLDDRWRHPLPGVPITTYLLRAAADGSFSIAVLVIRPGGRTPLHDHRTWTVWGTLEGRDRETRYQRGRAAADGFPDLRVVGTRVLPDDGVAIVPLPPGDLHVVENLGEAPSISIHVHGADMSGLERSAYDLERRSVRSFVQSYER